MRRTRAAWLGVVAAALSWLAVATVSGATPDRPASRSAPDGGAAKAAPVRKATAAAGLIRQTGPKLPRKAIPKRPGFKVDTSGLGFISQGLVVLVVLCFVVALAYVVLKLVGSWLGTTPTHAAKLVRVVERTSLETKKGLYVVDAAGSYLLLATHEGGVTRLAELDAAEVDRRIGPSPASKSFAQLLGLKRSPAGATASGTEPAPTAKDERANAEPVAPAAEVEAEPIAEQTPPGRPQLPADRKPTGKPPQPPEGFQLINPRSSEGKEDETASS